MMTTELWLIDIARSTDALAAVERRTPRLTAQDRRRVDALKDSAARSERRAVTIALRLLIERFAGPDLARLSFVEGTAGKPALPAPGVAFSLSHVDGFALLGLTRRGEIGVDLERERSLRFSAARREALLASASGLAGSAPAHATADACLIQAWCRLEAFAKAGGGGIGHALAILGVRGKPRPATELSGIARRTVREAGLAVRDIPMQGGLYAAAALEKPKAGLNASLMPANPSGLERLAGPAAARRASDR